MPEKSEWSTVYSDYNEGYQVRTQNRRDAKQAKLDSTIEELDKIDGELSLKRLREILKGLGCNGANVLSKAVTLTYGILTKCDKEQLREAERLGDEISSMEYRIKQLKEQRDYALEEAKEKNLQETIRLQKKESELNDKAEKIEEEQKKLSELAERINNAADQETKSKIIMAQWFRDNVDVKTAYDNTAFIVGLASVLGSPAAIDQIQEINPKLFEKVPTENKPKRRI